MAKTRFTAPHGLDAGNSVSTSCSLDRALLGVYSMQNLSLIHISAFFRRGFGIEESHEERFLQTGHR